MNVSVTHDPSTQRFVAVVDGQESVIDYRLADGTMTITHTRVPPSLRNRGIAGELTRFALETAREHGWKVVPVCPYAASYLKKHSEYSDLLA
ncbi:MAG: GNAT family N-acetyltransferase [Rhodanobacteraceae bacterium]